MYAILILCQ